jgi:hypothetical protein
MNAPFTPNSRRVILPQAGEGCKGLLIPNAIVILDGVRGLVTPKQYKELSGRPEAHCPCGAKVSFTKAHKAQGSFDIPDHFKTLVGHEHAPQCGYHFRKAARDLEREDHEYDSTKPYRIHLNFMDDEITKASLTRGTGLFYSRDDRGLPVNETHSDWQSVSVKTMDEFMSFIEAADPDRLKQSLVILNQQAVPWTGFCLSNNTPHRWARVYDDVTHNNHFLRLFMLKKTDPEQRNLFRAPSHYIPHDQVKFDFNGRSMVLRPCLNVSDETIDLCSKAGVTFVLSVPQSIRSMIAKKSAFIEDMTIPAPNGNLVGHMTSYPQFRAA